MLDALFAESDNALAVSRSFFHNDSAPVAAVELPAGGCCTVSVFGGVKWKGVDWDRIWRQAQAHGAQDCPICMMEIDVHDAQRESVLTSCSHLFHRTCLESFEEFGKNKHELAADAGLHIDKCPMCRSQYFKAALQPAAAAHEAPQLEKIEKAGAAAAKAEPAKRGARPARHGRRAPAPQPQAEPHAP
jgi:hypothetical protein